MKRSFDSIGYKSLPSDPTYGCITPPPFGAQCTLPREIALAACIAMPRCVAITCPEQAESHIGERGITGPICQLRSSRDANEKGHGMCRPSGCINVVLSRMRKPLGMHGWRAMGAPDLVNAPLRNPSLLFLRGDVHLRSTVLPEGNGRYWALQRGEEAASIPNAGLLFAVDATPPAANLTRSRDLRDGRAAGRLRRRLHHSG